MMYTDQPIFDAMAAATQIDKEPDGVPRIVMSAAKFIEVFNNHRDRALCTSLNVFAQRAPMLTDLLAMLKIEEDRLRDVEGLRMGDVAMMFQRLRTTLTSTDGGKAQ